MIPSVVARLARAVALADDLYERCQDWSAQHPPQISVERDEEGLATWYASTDATPPVELAVYAGEVVHHLRACLDHTVWALVDAWGGQPGKHTQFPIHVKPKSTTAALRGMPVPAQQLVRDAQPDGASPVPALLAVLALSNLDKHRSLYATQATAVAASASIKFRDDESSVVGSKLIFPTQPAYTSPGARHWIVKLPLVADIDLDELASYAKVTWHHDVEFYSSWERLQVGGPSKAFARIVREVREFLERFDPHFPATG